jgi:hypothetical protein
MLVIVVRAEGVYGGEIGAKSSVHLYRYGIVADPPEDCSRWIAGEWK